MNKPPWFSAVNLELFRFQVDSCREPAAYKPGEALNLPGGIGSPANVTAIK